MEIKTEAEIEEVLVEYAKKIQTVDDEINGLKEDRKEIIKDAKNDGVNIKALNAAIRKIRKNETDNFEEERYEEILRKENVIY